jgi:hypothetical protein
MGLFIPPRLNRVAGYANTVVSSKRPEDFNYLLDKHIKDIILFEDSKEDEDYINTNRIVLPRHYIIFVGTKDSVIQYKPYEYNQYRIVVSTYKDIIYEINSIG